MNYTFSEKHSKPQSTTHIKPHGKPAPDGNYILKEQDAGNIWLIKEDDMYLEGSIYGCPVDLYTADMFGFCYVSCAPLTTIVLTQE